MDAQTTPLWATAYIVAWGPSDPLYSSLITLTPTMCSCEYQKHVISCQVSSNESSSETDCSLASYSNTFTFQNFNMLGDINLNVDYLHFYSMLLCDRFCRQKEDSSTLYWSIIKYEVQLICTWWQPRCILMSITIQYDPRSPSSSSSSQLIPPHLCWVCTLLF